MNISCLTGLNLVLKNKISDDIKFEMYEIKNISSDNYIYHIIKSNIYYKYEPFEMIKLDFLINPTLYNIYQSEIQHVKQIINCNIGKEAYNSFYSERWGFYNVNSEIELKIIINQGIMLETFYSSLLNAHIHKKEKHDNNNDKVHIAILANILVGCPNQDGVNKMPSLCPSKQFHIHSLINPFIGSYKIKENYAYPSFIIYYKVNNENLLKLNYNYRNQSFYPLDTYLPKIKNNITIISEINNMKTFGENILKKEMNSNLKYGIELL
jgi:hypothetical protein